MPADFGIQILDGDISKLARLPDEAKDAILNMSANWSTIHDWALRWQERIFRSQGNAYGGTGWDYSTEPKYKDYKEGIDGIDASKVMRWRGGNERLYPSLTEKGDPEHLWNISGRSAEFGTSVPYAERLSRPGTNQFGEPRPARPTLRITPGAKVEAKEFLLRDVQERLHDKGVLSS